MINGTQGLFTNFMHEDLGRLNMGSPFITPYFGVGTYMPYGCNRDAFTLNQQLPDMQKVSPNAEKHNDKKIWAKTLTGAALLVGGVALWKKGNLQKCWDSIKTFCKDLITKFRT